MKRFALLFALLVLPIQVAGCGGDTTTTSAPAGGGGGDDGGRGEAKEYRAKENALFEAKAAKAKAQIKQP
jgi:hypothetical protein